NEQTEFTTTAEINPALDSPQRLNDERFLFLLYQDVLHRAIDHPGLIFWTNALTAGASRMQVVSAVDNSTENRTAQVQQLYATYLHRSVDNPGLASAVAVLQSGVTVDQLAVFVISSQEYLALHG